MSNHIIKMLSCSSFRKNSSHFKTFKFTRYFSNKMASSKDLLDDIEKVITNDIGNRGIANLIVENDFYKSCKTLTNDSKTVGICLGFSLFNDHKPYEENDGIHGAIYIAKALLHLKKEVVFFIDSHGDLLKTLLKDELDNRFISGSVQVNHVPENFTVEDTHILFDSASQKPKFSHLVSIERACRNSTNQYMTMKARDLTANCDPIDLLFLQAQSYPEVTTISIGDGGNEVGMGKVYDQVVNHIPNGKEIAASISCQHLITCGVSNWGGYALAAGMFILSCQNGMKDLKIEDFLLTDAEDEELNRYIAELGFRDGMNGKAGLTVDGLDYFKVHQILLQQIRNISSQALQYT